MSLRREIGVLGILVCRARHHIVTFRSPIIGILQIPSDDYPNITKILCHVCSPKTTCAFSRNLINYDGYLQCRDQVHFISVQTIGDFHVCKNKLRGWNVTLSHPRSQN